MARNSVSKNAYVTKNGDASRSPSPEAIIVQTTFADGTVEEIEVGKLSKEIRHCATLQGLSIKLQRSFASAKGDVNAAREAYETVRENLFAGIWVEESEGGGPRLSVLASAIEAMLVEAGQAVDDARRAAIAEKLKDEANRKAAMEDSHVKKHYERIKAERAMERAKQAADAASTGESSAVSMF